ncbi:MAG: PEP-CTERM sorting domain-containing protein, partial [bacterium]
SGLAHGNAEATHGFVVSASADASAPVVGSGGTAYSTVNAVADAVVDTGGFSPGVGSYVGYEAAGYALGAPRAFLLPPPGFNPTVTAALPGNNTDYLAFGVLRGGYSHNGAGAPVTNTIVLDFEFDMSQFTRDTLRIGFLDPAMQGNGFDEMRFQIFEEGALVFDQIFTDGAAALAFFNDRVIDLGNWMTGLSGNLDLEFRMDLTASNSADSFGASLVAGIVPEPGTFTLVALGLLAWRLAPGDVSQAETGSSAAAST